MRREAFRPLQFTSFLFPVAIVLGMGLSFALASTSSFAAMVQAPLLSRNPIDAPPAKRRGTRSYGVDLRVIRHGIAVDSKVWARQLRAAERIFSQCPGVNFTIRVAGESSSAYTQSQDRLFSANSADSALGPGFFEMLGPWSENRDPIWIDVHLVDHLEAESRKEAEQRKTISLVNLGQSFDARRLDGWYLDPRPAWQRTQSLSELGGDRLFLAMETLRSVEGIRRRVSKHVEQEIYYSSLLAHELGHFLLETQLDSPQSYHDHFCPSLGADCPENYLMTAGGYQDKIHSQHGLFSKRVRYSPLPKLDATQCEALVNHPKVYELIEN